MGFAHELENAASDRADALDDPIEEILHRPGELADVVRSDQAPAALERVKRPAHGDQRVDVAGIRVPTSEALLEDLDDLACLVDEHLDDVFVDFRLRQRFSRCRGRGGRGAFLAGVVRGALQRTNAVLRKLEQRVIVWLKADHRFQVILEAYESVGERIERLGARCEAVAREKR